MKNTVYQDAAGCVVTYKPAYETFTFNELNASCSGVKLAERGTSAAAFVLGDYRELLHFEQSSGYIFLQHVHPYLIELELTRTREDFKQFSESLSVLLDYLEPEEPLVAQCRIASELFTEYSNSDLTDFFAGKLAAMGFCVEPKAAKTAVSFTILNQHAFLGCSQIEDNISSWTGGVLFFSREDSVICRAENKLEEAFRYFAIPSCQGMRALDLGAAPGGWTNFLCKQGFAVDAVDPAGLDPRVLQNKTVTYYPMTAQQFNHSHSGEDYDLIVNDMKMDTNESIDILCELSRRLKKEGAAVLTLKLPKQGILKRIQIARTVLGRLFETVRIHQLYYNRSEVTVFMKQKKR